MDHIRRAQSSEQVSWGFVRLNLGSLSEADDENDYFEEAARRSTDFDSMEVDPMSGSQLDDGAEPFAAPLQR